MSTSFEKMIIRKWKKKTKIAASDNKVAKFQLNRGCRLGVKNVRLTFKILALKKHEKYSFCGILPTIGL